MTNSTLLDGIRGGAATSRVPTIEVSGKAIRRQPPKTGRIRVTISATSTDRETAWIDLQSRLLALRETLGQSGEVGNAVPNEREDEVTKVLRTATEFTVSADVEITFAPGAFGEVITAILENKLPYAAPEFTFDELPDISEEMFTEAAAVAKRNAQAVVAGVGATIGRLVGINVGPPRRLSVWRPLGSFVDNYRLSRSFMAFNRSMVDWDIDEEKFETFDTEVQVTVEFEVVEVSQ